jgi:CO dehydrogenase maturation factor
MKLAISGKGGVGKTTVAALLACLLAEEGQEVLAIDADPTTNLPLALGLPPELTQKIIPLGDRKDLIEERVGGQGAFFRLNPQVDDLLSLVAVEYARIKLIVMGTIKEGGSGCACPENTLLRAFLSHLFLERDEAVIVDMEAGLEHLGRRTVEAVDALLVIVEPSRNSILVAKKIKELAKGLGIRRVPLVANKISVPEERDFVQTQLTEEEIWAYLPYSEELRRREWAGSSNQIKNCLKDPLVDKEFRKILEHLEGIKEAPGMS